MIVMNECFLTNMGGKYGFDQGLPLRLQKRALLKALGFPGDPKMKKCRSCETDKVKKLFKEYSTEGYPFLIIVSEKPMPTLVPPLFNVKDTNRVQWRDNQGTKRFIDADKALSIIKAYAPNTWVEFSPCPWRKNAIAGRLIYVSIDNQIIEVQRGTIPSKLIDDRQLSTYVGELNFLDIERYRYLEDSRRLRATRYISILPFNIILDICRKMPEITSFKKLCLISKFPTLEFAITETGQMITIDIDWPAQWVENKKGG